MSKNKNNTQIFNDLDKLRTFCRDFGYKFDENDLYNQRSYVNRQFQKFLTGKSPKNQWLEDLARFNEPHDKNNF